MMLGIQRRLNDMGELVAAAAASHAPGIAGNPQGAGEQGARFYAGMDMIREVFAASKPDVIIDICNEHFVNFYLDNMPAICVGVADEYVGPIEPEERVRIPRRRIPGHREPGTAIVAHALDSSFPVSFSEELKLDHGAIVPLHFITPELDIPIVPIIVNNIAPPMPSPRLLYQFGELLRDVIRARPDSVRIAVLGTGGLSHWVGTPSPTGGPIDEEFDQRFLSSLEGGQGHALADLTDSEIGLAGNGAHEVRNWICVLGACGDAPAEVVAYEAVNAWVTGCGAAVWHL
jgi:hypothetical protein